MELKVWVEGIQRIVCGVTERTTCQDVVYALAHATGKTGRFTLIERWRNNERLLAPHEHPLKVLLKWGEYSNDVHFILQRTALETSTLSSAASKSANNNCSPSTGAAGNSSVSSNPSQAKSPKNTIDPLHGFTPPPPPAHPPADFKKSPAFTSPATSASGGTNIGIVRPSFCSNPAPPGPPENGAAELRRPLNGTPVDPYWHCAPSANGRSSLSPPGHRISSSGEESPRAPPPYRSPPHPPASSAGNRSLHGTGPPPYREPPRPRGLSPSYRCSPGPGSGPMPGPGSTHHHHNSSSFSTGQNRESPMVDTRPDPPGSHPKHPRHEVESPGPRNRPPTPPSDPQHGQLIQLVNRQREKMDSNQQILLRLERELADSEEQARQRESLRLEHEYQLGLEAARLEHRAEQQEEEIAMLAHVESQWDAVKREEEQLHGQLDRVRADLSQAESQLDAYHQTLRNLREQVTREEEDLTADLESQLARVRSDLEAAEETEHRLSSDDHQAGQQLAESEQTLRHLHEEIDRLTQEIKEANLQSLSIAPADDLKILLEGTYKSGHGRRMLGSPRQLENAVATNKNPHGVWV